MNASGFAKDGNNAPDFSFYLHYNQTVLLYYTTFTHTHTNSQPLAKFHEKKFYESEHFSDMHQNEVVSFIRFDVKRKIFHIH